MTKRTEQFYIQRIAELEAKLKQHDARISALEKHVAELLKINADLIKQVAQPTDKVAQLSKNSSNSSKPPSSDIVKPPRKAINTQGKIGGHPKDERPPFKPDKRGVDTKNYLSDLIDGQWALIAPLLPKAKPGGRPRKVDLPQIVNGTYHN